MLTPITKFLIVCSLAVAAACAQAAVGLDELPARGDDGPITIFYPSSSAEQAVQRGPFKLQVAPRGQPVRGNGRLVVVSHGSGGAPWTYTDLAKRLVEAGFVVALPEHQGDNYKDMSKVGPASWKRRPLEVSRAIDAVAHDERFKSLLSFDQVGMYGMSAGGHTALTLAGGSWSPSALLRHCEAHLDDDFPSCVGLALQLRGDGLDGLKKFVARHAIRWRLDDAQWYRHTDPRIGAVVAEVPFAVDFDLASLAKPPVPLGIVQAGNDPWLAPRYHSAPVIKACTPCEVVADLPTAGHGSLMSPQPLMLTGNAAMLLRDPPGFDRALVPQAHERIVAFFRKHLLVVSCPTNICTLVRVQTVMIGGWPEWVQTGRLDPLWTPVEGAVWAEPFGLPRIGPHAALRPQVNTSSIDLHPRLACGPMRGSESTDICGTGH